MLKNLSLLVALTFTSSFLTADCEPTPTEPAQWSNGDYYFQSVYTFSFQSAPYILTIAGSTFGDDAQGNVEGEYNWVFWLDRDSYDSGNPPDCVLSETLVGEALAPIGGTIDYSSCLDCDPFSTVTTTYSGSQGPNCTDALFDFWYLDEDTGEYDNEFNDVWGYRHAETAGWPSEFSTITDALDAGGWEGSMYTMLISSDDETMEPVFIVIPEDTITGQKSDLLRPYGEPIEVAGPHAFRP